jgi:hypothetical protein
LLLGRKVMHGLHHFAEIFLFLTALFKVSTRFFVAHALHRWFPVKHNKPEPYLGNKSLEHSNFYQVLFDPPLKAYLNQHFLLVKAILAIDH